MIKVSGTVKALISELESLHTPKDDILTMEIYYTKEVERS